MVGCCSPSWRCECSAGTVWTHQRTFRSPPRIVRSSGSAPSECSGWLGGWSCPEGPSCCMVLTRCAAHPLGINRYYTDGLQAPNSYQWDNTQFQAIFCMDLHFKQKTNLMSNFRWPGSSSSGLSRYFWITWTCPWLSMYSSNWLASWDIKIPAPVAMTAYRSQYVLNSDIIGQNMCSPLAPAEDLAIHTVPSPFSFFAWYEAKKTSRSSVLGLLFKWLMPLAAGATGVLRFVG